MKIPVLAAYFAVVACILEHHRDRFEAWVKRTDWRRKDRHLSHTAVWLLFVIGCYLLHAVALAFLKGSFTVAVR